MGIGKSSIEIGKNGQKVIKKAEAGKKIIKADISSIKVGTK